MIETVRSWIMGIAGAAFMCAICGELTGTGRVKAVEKAIGGFIVTIALISPLIKFDIGSYSINLAKYRNAAESISASAGEISDTLSRTFIAERCEAYILDKAKLLGLSVSDAEVELRWSGEGVWYPVKAKIYGDFNYALAEKIEEELGVSRENQYWSGDEND